MSSWPRPRRSFLCIGQARRFRNVLARGLAGLYLLAAMTSARPAESSEALRIFSPAFSGTIPSGGASLAATFATVDHRSVALFKERGGGRVLIPVEGREIELELRPFDVFAPGAIVTRSGDDGARRIASDVALFRGAVIGAQGSWAVLSMSPRGVIGVVSWNDRRIGIGPVADDGGPRSARGLHAIGDADSPAHPDFRCAADDLPVAGRSGLVVPEAMRGTTPLAPETTARLWCDLALDCDYEYYANKHGSNLGAAVDYAVTLVGVVSSIYESEVNVSIRVSYLNVWTTSSDPYSAANTSSELPEFQNYWQTAHGDVSRHIAHLLSGRSLGGGIAWLEVLCNRPMGYAVSQVDGIYSYPTSATTWDAFVLSHEIGHNFSSHHTHSCWWQQNGYAPTGALLDSCTAAEGGCYSGPTGIVPAYRGTIMSYCHLLGPINSTVKLQFHPACRTVIRNHAEQCLPEGAFDPKVNLSASASGYTVTLDWSPSPTSAVIRYDVYRSATSLDPNPVLAGSTTDTAYVDPGRTGTYFYRVRAVRSADVSAYGNEQRVEACAQSSTNYFESGAANQLPIVADWNEDGILDIAVANNVPSGTAAIVLGNGTAGVGNGTFAAPAFFDAGVKPAGVATADFNEDGILDLAITNNAASGSYSILLGQGSGGIWNGSFAAPVAYSVGSLPLVILARDFNEDGVTDLAMACSGSSTVAIALGQGALGVGNGTFAPASNIVIGSGPVAIETGDFNENGILDLAVVRNTTGTVSIFYGNGSGGRGNGTFSAGPSYSAGSGAAAIVTGDWNEDGITDFAVARREDPGSVSVLLGAGAGGVGNGTFSPRVEYPCAPMPTSIVAADFNGDGIADLGLVNSEGSGSAIDLFGKGTGTIGNGTFEPQITRTIGALPTALAAADFDEDGSPDLAIAHTANPLNLGILLGACTGSVADGITVISPNGGESWAATTEHAITWTRGPAVQAVTLEVSRGGGSWETIAVNVTDTSYPWTVTEPATGGQTAIVRVRDSVVPTRADQSNAPFTIGSNPLLDATSPAAVELALDPVFPNPARAGLFVSFALPRADAATLELIDVAGRLVAARHVGALGAGRHVLDLAHGVVLPSGLYFVRLVQGERRLVTRAAVLR
jgi:hypothetical protein